jgi:DNA-binding transcriptional ArsR family regulator
MSERAFSTRPQSGSTALDRPPGVIDDDRDPAVDPEEALSLLSDEYARAVLETLCGEPLSARALLDRLDMSRATMYRRLSSLEEADLVEAEMTYDPDGHHRKRFRTAFDGLTVSFEDDGVVVAQAD